MGCVKASSRADTIGWPEPTLALMVPLRVGICGTVAQISQVGRAAAACRVSAGRPVSLKCLKSS